MYETTEAQTFTAVVIIALQARGVAPAIIFIDEIDAVGRIRGGAQGNDERDTTLNQMLSEMDGFGDGVGVIVMAATNRKDVLDPALIRPGRFDRIIQVGLPDVMGRVETFQVGPLRTHCSHVQSMIVKLSPTLQLRQNIPTRKLLFC